MPSAVHSDRSGRIVLAADYAAAMSDGVAARPLAPAIPLPAGAEVVALTDREAVGLDRSGRPRPLGAGRWAAGAILPGGFLRIGLPAYTDDAGGEPLRPRSYTAVGADADGALVVSAVALEPEVASTDERMAPGLGSQLGGALRQRPANRAIRQLARCAREYRCRAAANTFLRRHDGALPIGAPTNERPSALIALRDDAEASPDEPAAFHPSATEVADIAIDHLEAGGGLVCFGRACEGEPLLDVRTIESAIHAIRARTRRGAVHVETNGSLPAALRRLIDAGLDSVAFRIASARSETYEAIHRPDGYRFTDVRSAIVESAERKVAIALMVLVLPGLTDLEREIEAIIALGGELPTGSALLLRNMAADPYRALRVIRATDPPMGVERALERMRADASHLRIGTMARALERA